MSVAAQSLGFTAPLVHIPSDARWSPLGTFFPFAHSHTATVDTPSWRAAAAQERPCLLRNAPSFSAPRLVAFRLVGVPMVRNVSQGEGRAQAESFAAAKKGMAHNGPMARQRPTEYRLGVPLRYVSWRLSGELGPERGAQSELSAKIGFSAASISEAQSGRKLGEDLEDAIAHHWGMTVPEMHAVAERWATDMASGKVIPFPLPAKRDPYPARARAREAARLLGPDSTPPFRASKPRGGDSGQGPPAGQLRKGTRA